MGKLTINGNFPIAMLNYQRCQRVVNIPTSQQHPNDRCGEVAVHMDVAGSVDAALLGAPMPVQVETSETMLKPVENHGKTSGKPIGQ